MTDPFGTDIKRRPKQSRQSKQPISSKIKDNKIKGTARIAYHGELTGHRIKDELPYLIKQLTDTLPYKIDLEIKVLRD